MRPNQPTELGYTEDSRAGKLSESIAAAQNPSALAALDADGDGVADNAAALDGLASTQFIRSDASDSFDAGVLTEHHGAFLALDNNASANIATRWLEIGDGTGAPGIGIDFDNEWGGGPSNNVLRLAGSSGVLTLSRVSGTAGVLLLDIQGKANIGDDLSVYNGDVLIVPDGTNTVASMTTTQLRLGDVTGGDYVQVAASDGTMTFAGAATYWRDLLIPALSTRGPASGAPTLVSYKTTLALLAFDKNTDNTVHFSVQMPHEWKEGSRIYPHVHWVPKSSDVSTKKNCMWAMEYTWANYTSTFGASSTVYNNTTLLDEMHVADKHYITALKDGSGNAYIDGTGKTLSSILICRLYRDADGTLGTDNYDDDAYLVSIDFHYECDSLGSNEEYTK